MQKKPRVLFPFTEAGLGHIMPMRSIADAFEKKYGHLTEIVRSNFFTEGGNKYMMKFEQKMANFVRHQNRSRAYSRFSCFNMDFWGVYISSWATMTCYVPGVRPAAVSHMEALAPDLVVSTHWATNYYASKMKNKPLLAMYCPDAYICTLFRYPADLCMVSMATGYRHALKRHPLRFNEDNLKLVPFSIRKEAFEVPTDKAENRRALGWDENKFTVILAEGGYGIGQMKRICELLIERDLPINLVPVCGKNEELFAYFKSLRTGKRISFHPQGFAQDILRMIAASDLFCGKSGNIIAEPTFFGVPAIITNCATVIERRIAEYYVDYVGSAERIFDPVQVADRIEAYIQDPSLLDGYRERALAHREDHYGSEKAADYIFALLKTRNPYLAEAENAAAIEEPVS
ncbi:MAG: hypothetical protein IJY71_07915 [Clostridia bacterium]|nr:hypothetical protein [Clostridia bacterium]